VGSRVGVDGVVGCGGGRVLEEEVGENRGDELSAEGEGEESDKENAQVGEFSAGAGGKGSLVLLGEGKGKGPRRVVVQADSTSEEEEKEQSGSGKLGVAQRRMTVRFNVSDNESALEELGEQGSDGPVTSDDDGPTQEQDFLDQSNLEFESLCFNMSPVDFEDVWKSQARGNEEVSDDTMLLSAEARNSAKRRLTSFFGQTQNPIELRTLELEEYNASLLSRLLRARKEKHDLVQKRDNQVSGLQEELQAMRERVSFLERARVEQVSTISGLEQDKDSATSEALRLRREVEEVTEQLKLTRVRLTKRIRELECDKSELEARLIHTSKERPRGGAHVGLDHGESVEGLELLHSPEDNHHIASVVPLSNRVETKSQLTSDHNESDRSPRSSVESTLSSVPSNEPSTFPPSVDDRISMRRKYLRRLLIEEIHSQRYRTMRAVWLDFFEATENSLSSESFERHLRALPVPDIQKCDVEYLKKEIQGCSASFKATNVPKEDVSWAQFVKFFQVTKNDHCLY